MLGIKVERMQGIKVEKMIEILNLSTEDKCCRF